MLKIGHEVVRPGRHRGDEPVTIPVPEELETVPGIPLNQREVDWYAREYPLETMNITERASRDWANAIRDTHIEMREIRKEHDKLNRPLVMAARLTGDQDPTVEPTGGDVSQDIKDKAKDLGFLEVGITYYDYRYTYQSKKDYVKFPHVICLAYEQDFEPTQTIPSIDAEIVHSSTYRTEGAAALELAAYINSIGYHAQIQSPTDNTGPYIPMFVEAGLGQLGACGYLLTPSEGSRCRLIMITTDANVSYDKPVDYGIHAFCQVCQVCVNRCPGRALMRDKIWWRGLEKNKLYFKRCRPIMARYLGCGICMKVCPIQKYGLKNVMEHYADTGQVLGKGTHDLEGYTIEGKGYFGPGELPVFDRGFFDMPQGDTEGWAFDNFKKQAAAAGGVISDELMENFRQEVARGLSQSRDDLGMMEEEDYI
ncbi:3-chloro-4-hydroxyphenylacetate reductive dehalogenase [Geodia barretti]|uniref:3-chloro-4-hydroxyphenylacetate reductive dehalogenase n=1 Tax=Geodia barretti TaxID=519541 RepID=A0AA35WT02_GEOBA|nr:3-chloro-4-hydroxyphenylacetate reductive dehalogenase [Geodia barretti]